LEQKTSLLGAISSFEATIDAVKKADHELFQNLRLFAERLTLFRITRVKEKGPELARFATTLIEAGKMKEECRPASEEITSFEALANEKLSAAEVSGLFSAMVDALESLDARQLYYILEKLRSAPISGR
jgi:hypothetical protein